MSFNVCVDRPFLNCEKIFPVAQHDVRRLLDVLENDQTVSRVIIFGSACTSGFEMWSDVDVYVDGTKDMYHGVYNPDVAYDMWCPAMVDDNLLSEIMEKGVVVYERST